MLFSQLAAKGPVQLWTPSAGGNFVYGLKMNPTLQERKLHPAKDRNDLIQIVRIEKSLYQEFARSFGYIGSVGRIYQNGFDLIRKNGRPIYFGDEKNFLTPFGAVLELPLASVLAKVRLQEGDIFIRNGRSLVRQPGNACSFYINPAGIVNLKRTIYPSPPAQDTLRYWIQILTEKIFKWGKFEGLAGTLNLIKEALPKIIMQNPPPPSLWSRHALQGVKNLLKGPVDEDLTEFKKSWDGLLGLGPGLTPAGDDFLVGFLAAHKLFCSRLGTRLARNDLKRRLTAAAKNRTNQHAFQFLHCSLEGIFSESIYLVIGELLRQRHLKDQSHGIQEIQPTPHMENFLKWGHSSGTDTMTGIVFGLFTIYH